MTEILPAPETLPDAHGHFGAFGGMFVPETLMFALNELSAEYDRAKADPAFQVELDYLLRAGRRPFISQNAGRKNWAGRRFTRNGKICSTPVPTRSTTRWGRF